MIHRIAMLFFVLGTLTSYAQSVNLRGTVTNDDGEPLSGAVVTLLGQGLKDTTGDDGAYAIQTTPVMTPRSTAAGLVTLTGSLLEFKLSRPSPVTIEVFDIKNNLLKSEKKNVQEAGVYGWDVAKKYPSNQLLIIRASVAGEISTFRFMPLTGDAGISDVNRTASKGGFLAKAAAAVDSLEIVASGYGTKVVEVETYDEIMDVILSITDIWGGPGNPPGPSAGCGQPAAITTGDKTIMSGGRQRQYMIDVPEDYDPDKPYRLFYASHGLGGEDHHVAEWWNYFGLKTQAEAANEPAIFIAPQAIERWGESDHALFDDITDLAKENLCVDTTRIFVTGMSFGGMITYSLSTNHQSKFRAGVALAPANYNIWLPDTKLKEPIAWMQTTGMSDGTTPWVNNEAQMTGSKFIALEKAADNGCVVPEDIETWDQNHPTRHICVDLEGCQEGYPVKVCTFDGGHWQFPYDGGSGEDLERSWVPVESWKFFTQF